MFPTELRETAFSARLHLVGNRCVDEQNPYTSAPAQTLLIAPAQSRERDNLHEYHISIEIQRGAVAKPAGRCGQAPY